MPISPPPAPITLPQDLEGEVGLGAAALFVVEAVDAHVGFLELLGAVGEGGIAVGVGGDADGHIGRKDFAVAPDDSLGGYFKNSWHNASG